MEEVKELSPPVNFRFLLETVGRVPNHVVEIHLNVFPKVPQDIFWTIDFSVFFI